MKSTLSEKAQAADASRTPAVKRAIDYIQLNIASGKFSRGTKLPSEHELTDQTGLSRGTIRKAIECLIDSGDLKRKPSSRPIVTGRPPKTSRSTANEIHVWITQPIANPVTLQFLQGVSTGLMGTQFRTVVREPLKFLRDHVGEEEREFLENLLESPQAAGAILERDPFAKNDDLFEKLLAQGRHLVFVDISAPDGLNADHVGTSNVSASRKAANYLITKGHQDVWFVTDSDVAMSSLSRIDGYWRALSQAGLKEKGKVIVATSLPAARLTSLSPGGTFVPHLKYSPSFDDLGKRVVESLLELPKLPSAIMVNCDALAFWVLAYLQGASIKVPEQVAVIGFDWIARWEDPKIDVLTTMSQDFEGFGLHAADLLLDRLTSSRAFSPRHVLLDAPLVLRSSTGS
jgi:DNA-binding LacI/PurR family transcriptional regulator